MQWRCPVVTEKLILLGIYGDSVPLKSAFARKGGFIESSKVSVLSKMGVFFS